MIKQWEYTTWTSTHVNGQAQDAMVTFGNEGWELVGVTQGTPSVRLPNGNGYVLWFKREKIVESPYR